MPNVWIVRFGLGAKPFCPLRTRENSGYTHKQNFLDLESVHVKIEQSLTLVAK